MLQFTIACAETIHDSETLSEFVVTSPGKPNYKVTLPSGTTIADVRGKKVFAVIPSGDYSDLKVELSTSGATYRCASDITSRIGTNIASADKCNFTLNLGVSSITRTAGIMIQLGGGDWQSWADAVS